MNPRVLVYGDVMLDFYVTGSVRRQSPEAFCPVLSDTETKCFPGGAANVAANAAAMGGEAMVCGVVGRDPPAAMLEAALDAAGASMELLVRDGARTTTKTRFVSSEGQHLLRVDSELTEPLSGADETEFFDRLVGAALKAQAVVISDYAKGAVTPRIAEGLIETARMVGIPVVVDSKTPRAEHFHRATVLKPNLKEIAQALGCPEPTTDATAIPCALSLWRLCKSDYVLLTRGKGGMCLVADDRAMTIRGHRVKEVDVTGAGDTVAASLALALARREGIVEAAMFANAAAAVAVSKRGTACPTPEEIAPYYDRNAGSHPRPGRRVEAAEPHSRLH